MLRLLLLRHAKTERDSPSGLDRDRPLAPRGLEDAPRIGAWMARRGLVPDLALVSTAIRARQTWDLVSSAMPGPVATEFAPQLYGADPAELLGAARDAVMSDGGAPYSVLIVAHNPGLHELALALVSSGAAAARDALSGNLPTGALAVIDFDVADWRQLAFRRGCLVHFMTPSLLPPSP